jgi:putative FmdB family regulatory protein
MAFRIRHFAFVALAAIFARWARNRWQTLRQGGPTRYNARSIFFLNQTLLAHQRACTIMPIYEYRCNECGRQTEALQRLSEAPLVNCPSCGKPALQKLVSAAGFQLKGSGWYATDFRNGGGGKKPDKANVAPDAATGETKSEGAAKTESATAAAPPAGATPPTSSES